MKLSENFTLQELIKSPQASRKGLRNDPSEEVIANLKCLVENILQPLRNAVNAPVVISSGYRSPEVNKLVGGAKASEHLFGYAADIEVPSLDNKQLFNYVKRNFKFTQLILEFYEEGIPDSGWVHISYNPNNLQNKCLRAIKQGNKTVYLPY